jgi:hypothetical protein
VEATGNGVIVAERVIVAGMGGGGVGALRRHRTRTVSRLHPCGDHAVRVDVVT